MHTPLSGADPGFHVRVGAQLKKLRRAERGVNIFGVFRVKNHDFTTKKSYFFQYKGVGCFELKCPCEKYGECIINLDCNWFNKVQIVQGY